MRSSSTTRATTPGPIATAAARLATCMEYTYNEIVMQLDAAILTHNTIEVHEFKAISSDSASSPLWKLSIMISQPP